DYDEARMVWNAMHHARPAIIVQVASASDVARALRYATANGLPVAVRGGGHSVAGNGTVEAGMVIDLGARMRSVTVDPATRIVTVEGGVTLGEMDAAAQAHGLAVPTGVISMTGVAGLTLGGGVGWLTRAHGLAADNLLAAEVVLADGSVVRAAPDADAALLEGLRGGGGNFGVVTRLDLQAYPLGPDVLAGGFIWHQPRWAEALRAFAAWTPTLPDAMTSIVTFITLPAAWEVSDDPVMLTGFVWADEDREAGMAHIEALRALATPDIEAMDATTWVAWQSSVDEMFAGHPRAYWKNIALANLDDATVDAIVEQAARLPAAGSGLDIHHMGGAMTRVPPGGSMFPNRTAPYWVNAYGVWRDESIDDAGIAWARSVHEALRPSAAPGEYVNFLGSHETDPDGPRAAALRAYGAETLERLVALKRRVDPTNVFRRNHNIPLDTDA
ncbi:MAG: FAD-binding oxidoreductase, partial [Candidatus Limnocylindrales bacterium]